MPPASPANGNKRNTAKDYAYREDESLIKNKFQQPDTEPFTITITSEIIDLIYKRQEYLETVLGFKPSIDAVAQDLFNISLSGIGEFQMWLKKNNDPPVREKNKPLDIKEDDINLLDDTKIEQKKADQTNKAATN